MSDASPGAIKSVALKVWADLHRGFDTDDGSLPDIHIEGLTDLGIDRCFKRLRGLVAVGSPQIQFWDREALLLRPVDAAPDFAKLMALGKSDSVHFLVQGATVFGATLPDIGVFVHPDSIGLDFRMGHDWSPERLLAFVRLINELQMFEPHSIVRHDFEVQDESTRRLVDALESVRRLLGCSEIESAPT